jgi:hypothetical protein
MGKSGVSKTFDAGSHSLQRLCFVAIVSYLYEVGLGTVQYCRMGPFDKQRDHMTGVNSAWAWAWAWVCL